MLLEFSLDIHLVWAEGNAAGLQGSTSGMKELGCQQTMRRCSSICAVDPPFCGHGLTTTWRPRPGKAVHLARIQVVVVCTLESRIPCHQARQLTLAPLTLPQEHKTETRNRISRDPERMLAGHNLT